MLRTVWEKLKTNLLVYPITEVIHLDLQGNLVVDIFEQLQPIAGNEGVVIKWVELVHRCRLWKGLRVVVYQITGDVGI